MERTAVESSQLKSIGYDPATQTLEIEFKEKKGGAPGGVYQYSNFPPAQWAAFQAAESKGSFFIRNIKNNPAAYPYTKIG